MASVRTQRQGELAGRLPAVARAAAVLGALYAWGPSSTFAAPFGAPRASPPAAQDVMVRGGTSVQSTPRAVYRLASAEEEGLTSAINNGNKDRIIRAIEAMPAAPKDAFKMTEGQWKVSWDSNMLGPTKNSLLKHQCDVLPSVLVQLYFQYNEIKGGRYRWFQAFTMPGFERTNAAIMMSGPIKKGKKGNTATVQLDTVQLVPTNAGTGESKEAMRSLGLDRYMKPQKLKDDGPIEIEMAYISDETFVQLDEVGNKYVMAKMSESYPIPYVYDSK